MLEYNFTKLDDDFITLWSRYILTDDFSKEDMNALKNLACLGQINAIQSWYLFNGVGDCKEIDEKVKLFEKEKIINHNKLWALASYYKCIESDEYLRLNNEINNIYDKINKESGVSTYIVNGQKFAKFEDEEEQNKYLKIYSKYSNELNEIIIKINKLKYIQYMKSAVDQIISLQNSNRRMFLAQRANEMLVCWLLDAGLTKGQYKEYEDAVSNNNKITVKHFAKCIKEELKKNKKFTACDDPQLAFHFVKSILLFDEIKKSKKIVDIANEYIDQLAFREYSKELQEAINKEGLQSITKEEIK